MEELDYFHGCSYRAGTPQFSLEKQGKPRGDQFVIEDLLDLSNGEEEDGMTNGEYGGSEAITEFSSTASSTVTTVDSSSNCVLRGPGAHFSGELISRGLTDTGLSSDLCVPHDDLAELEWLSNFVEDSFSSKDLQKLQLTSAPKSASSSASHGDDSTPWAPQPPFSRPEAPVPGKARSKRSRSVPCNWSSRLLLLSSLPIGSSVDPNGDIVQSSSLKKAASKEASSAEDGARKCLHCTTDKTPQWRMGPLGPKTLCNACGVRFKSGRLVPEYRPAASPTFVLSKHSNSHRKVLELRRQKELQQPRFPVPAPAGLFNDAESFTGGDFVIQHFPRNLV